MERFHIYEVLSDQIHKGIKYNSNYQGLEGRANGCYGLVAPWFQSRVTKSSRDE